MIPRGGEEELLSAMLIFAENAELRERLGAEAQRTAERFKRERVAVEWIEIIEQV